MNSACRMLQKLYRKKVQLLKMVLINHRANDINIKFSIACYLCATQDRRKGPFPLKPIKSKEYVSEEHI